MSTPTPQELAFLETLNRNLPQGVDWKQGALDYLANLFGKDSGDGNRRFHLIKPFHSVYPIEQPINLQMTEFVREVSHFLNVLSIMRLDHDAQFLDVACGSGWFSHFLTKLRIPVTGVDISPDMIQLAEERLAHDPVRTVDNDQFNAKFLVHDMEQAPLKIGAGFDVAVLESALHHFVNPIQTLRNIAESLNDRGIIVILEAASDGQGDQHHMEIMRQYNTLERPYTREQLVEIIGFAGFPEYQFLYPVNGFFPQTAVVANAIRSQILYGQAWNTVVMSKQAGILADRLEIQSIHTVVPTVADLSSAQSMSLTNPLPIAPESNNGLGIKGELKILANTSQRILRKSIAKLTGQKPS
jgi:SAM-dependent methyltransferase